jgi:acyl carrier protein
LSSISVKIREVIEAHGQLVANVSKLKDTDDLFEYGMSSHATINVMLALESEFGIEFPDSLLRRTSFQSIDAIREVIESLGVTDIS